MPQINPVIFREYDIRGIYGKDLFPETAELIGKAFGSMLLRQNGKNVIVGKDLRKSSDALHSSLIKGILSTGCNAIDVSLAPTPAVYYAENKMNADASIVVTASHLPKEFNGFKLSIFHESLSGEKIQELRKTAEAGNFSSGSGRISYSNILDAYVSEAASGIKIKKKLKIAVDCSGAMASLVAEKLFRKLGIEIIPLNCSLDPEFSSHPEPDPTMPENLESLIETVVSEKCDFGIAFDGDMDRVGAVDGKGRIIFGDILLAIFSRPLLKENPDSKIVFEVKCSQALIEDIERHKGIPVMWKTGHSLIKKKMREENALLGGEMSGHLFFRDRYFGFDDALYAAARLAELVSSSDESLASMVSEIPVFVSTPELRVDCPENEKFLVVEEAKKRFSKTHDVIDIDGVRIKFPDKSWALIRASNTGPKLVIRFEARSEKGLEEIKSLVKKELLSVNPSLKLPF